jgi:hypothetical protein
MYQNNTLLFPVHYSQSRFLQNFPFQFIIKGNMTISQEDALYDYLENVTEPFELEDVVAYIRMIDSKRINRLAAEVEAFINSRNIAFQMGNRRWISRRGCFEPVRFVISPTRLELLNGILIPGHRCVPFANPALLPHEYSFLWKGDAVPFGSTEGSPDEFYPYYSIFGEEYAPQYIARDNPENEQAFNSDPYDDPPEVSIHTLDMRGIYRETAFIPGDRFIVRTADWKNGIFELEKTGKDDWKTADLYEWFEAAEGGFEDSFNLLGPAISTEEQIAYAYWYGRSRIREVPAYSLEEFLYEKTDRIETAAYGIETRFWYSGREIPDRKDLDGNQTRPDKTLVEDILFRKNIPVSEYVVQSYVRDSLYRGEKDVSRIIKRIVPPCIELSVQERKCLIDYITEALGEFEKTYSAFADKTTGPIRQRVGELHTAVVELAARLRGGETDPSWLPKHTFIIFSQIQSHAAGVMEDLDAGPTEAEIEAMDNSLDSMIETYEDIKELIEKSLDNFRRNKLSLVKSGNETEERSERLIQISVGGTEIWRRVMLPQSCRLEDLHIIIQTILGWKNSQVFQFSAEHPLDTNLTIKDLGGRGVMEILYEYGAKWTVKIILLSQYEKPGKTRIRCVAGAGAAPPEFIDGPLRFRRIISALEKGNDSERMDARQELGQDFDPALFDMEACNRNLNSGLLIKDR